MTFAFTSDGKKFYVAEIGNGTRKFEVYYAKYPDFIDPKPPSEEELAVEYAKVAELQADSKEQIFLFMQAEVWAKDNNIVDSIIRGLNLNHTSMSVGDVVKHKGEIWMCDHTGWKKAET